jgi:hypothetical protein
MAKPLGGTYRLAMLSVAGDGYWRDCARRSCGQIKEFSAKNHLSIGDLSGRRPPKQAEFAFGSNLGALSRDRSLFECINFGGRHGLLSVDESVPPRSNARPTRFARYRFRCMGLNRLDRTRHRIDRVGRSAGCRSDDFPRPLIYETSSDRRRWGLVHAPVVPSPYLQPPAAALPPASPASRASLAWAAGACSRKCARQPEGRPLLAAACSAKP